MKTLVVEDDFVSRLLLQKILIPYGETHIAVNGKEAIEAFKLAQDEKRPYDLICLDIMMPEMDGHEVLKKIREMEQAESKGLRHVKVVMTTALSDSKNVISAFKSQCDGYLTKPLDKRKLLEQLHNLGLLQYSAA
jgi:two-component system chemotaxis response regulator CheY